MRAQIKSILLVLAFVGMSGCASLLTPDVRADPTTLRDGAYDLDPAHATLLFKVNHLGFSQYVGRFNAFEASLDFEAAAPEAAKLQVVVDMNSLDVNNPSFGETLMGAGWFNAESFPQAVFTSTSIEVTGEATGRVTGDLTLGGVTAPVTLDVTFNGGARNPLTQRYTVGFMASGAFNRSTFGISNFIGPVGDEVELEIHAEFLRR